MYSMIFFLIWTVMWRTTYPWESPRRKRAALFSKFFKIFFVFQNNKILSENRHYSTSFCFLLKVKEDLNGLPGYISVSLSLLKDFFSISQPCCHYVHSILFLPLVNLMHCQVLSSGFGCLAATPIWSHQNNFRFGIFWGFFLPSLEDIVFKV